MYRHHHPGPRARGFQSFSDMAARFEGFAPGFAPGVGRARRGDVRSAILRLLAEQPMHGYQIIHELADRSGGVWTPSPGSVYPTLQMLADEGLVDAEQSGGKKVYHLTEAGRTAAAGLEGKSAPWEDAAASTPDISRYRQAAARLAQAVFQVGTTGTEAQRAAAYEVIESARKQIHTILAQD
ncbi:Transcriptional regulator PadR-like family protein [Raineyella antarctica]|uniref:Transcriptional regulator PadR-like family protein n=1 Tax=Raineyella antarctica TaxID=1577474 RepID=A0A1G6IFP7_9ACTN|nr:PadR family transcriptional regulator [Raineyella antarctica]SDC05220.1 Transcriptional regulator PadR-like family protein [Raineyella antarctica]